MKRPNTFSNIIGQKQVLDKLKIIVNAAKAENRAMPHILFHGPPGLGKTTLALVLANERNVDIQLANGANLRSLKHLLPFLAKIKENSILFIDEVHRMTKVVEEFLYPAMEDFYVTIGKEEDVVKMELPPYTLVGATTEAGQLSLPFFDRFVYKCRLSCYNIEELVTILKNSSQELNLSLPEEYYKKIAECSKGTPRLANGLLSWVHDYVLAKSPRLDFYAIDEIIKMHGINPKTGLDQNDEQYLELLKQSKKPLGLKTISCMLNLSVETVEYLIEPHLLRSGLVRRTKKGRVYNNA